jgi:STAM-binding protein
MTLVTKGIPNHPSYRHPDSRVGVRAAQKQMLDLIPQMETLKSRIEARCLAWQKAMERRIDALDGERAGRQIPFDPAASDPAVAGNTTTLAAAENSDLAVKLAHNEIRRRETKRKGMRPGLSEQQEQERRTAGLWDDWEAALSKRGPDSNGDDEMRRNMEASRRRMDEPNQKLPEQLRIKRPMQPFSRPTGSLPKVESTEYHYPTIPKSQPPQFDGRPASRSRSKSPQRLYHPPKPPKEKLEESREYDGSLPAYQEPPPRPKKDTLDSENRSMTPVQAARDYTFKPSAYLENGNPLRTVFLPPYLRHKFLQYAAPNTRNNLETCGMLCGTLISNALFISHVVIPEQESTSDTCETINESAFFDYCASEDLMVLGWIHTHPSQTCFMSSRDLHTHCGYQTMMAESIAIVCAPSKTPS